MTRAPLATVVVALAASAGGCAGAALDAGPVSLASKDQALLDNASALIFSFSTAHTCADLVDLPPSAIGELLAPEGAPLQILDANAADHVFGKVPPDVPIAYFVLASSQATDNQRVAFDQFTGTVFAVGCRDFSAPSGTRHDLPLTLFPVGLR